MVAPLARRRPSHRIRRGIPRRDLPRPHPRLNDRPIDLPAGRAGFDLRYHGALVLDLGLSKSVRNFKTLGVPELALCFCRRTGGQGMKIFHVALLACVFGTTVTGNPEEGKSPHVKKRCRSSTGKSVYDLNFSLPLRNGQIRYRFMGQDVLYSVTLNKVTDALVTGRAEFESSATGETRGTSFDFSYEPKAERFSETSVRATCK